MAIYFVLQFIFLNIVTAKTKIIITKPGLYINSRHKVVIK